MLTFHQSKIFSVLFTFLWRRRRKGQQRSHFDFTNFLLTKIQNSNFAHDFNQNYTENQWWYICTLLEAVQPQMTGVRSFHFLLSFSWLNWLWQTSTWGWGFSLWRSNLKMRPQIRYRYRRNMAIQNPCLSLVQAVTAIVDKAVSLWCWMPWPWTCRQSSQYVAI